MKVLLAGGSGTLGTLATDALRADCHEVTRLGRGAANDARADLLDRDAVLRAVDGHGFDVVVHAATAIGGKSMTRHQDMYPTDELRTTGTVNLLAAARATGARRFVAESMMFGYGYGDHGGAPVTEDGTPFGPRGRTAPLERHVGAMRIKEELTFTADGIEGIALRFGLFYGGGTTDTHMVPLLRARRLPTVADRGRAQSWVELADAARAVAASVTGGRAGEAYNVCEDEAVSFGTHLRTIAEAFGTPRPLTVPAWLLRAAPLAHSMMTTDLRMANAKAAEGLGWRPTYRSSVEGVRALAARAGALAA
ncbi:NAD-dependent epimerase/dehydratase family protein [Streptomyces sp. KL116D]|uniref:NAD-dependent epimerase/dehydratase family protein n=1 Tax=Streptomyces sp. KL116D TaxID=3045152 RepID=UPI0035589CAD